MKCTRTREQLLKTGAAAGDQDARRHLDECAACRSFAERLQQVRAGLRRHHAGIEPDPAFSQRLSARLEQEDSPLLMGHVALRLLPLSAALLVVLLLVSAGTPRLENNTAEEPTEDAYISWVLQDSQEDL